MAANLCTSTTGTVTGTDPNFVVAIKTMAMDGVMLMVKYTKGTETGVSITIDGIRPAFHATDKYRHVTMSGASVSAYTLTLSATGNYAIPIELFTYETKVYFNVTFSSAGQSGAIVVNFVEN